MTLMEWGALGELIGGIAIIVSLIYVGVQVKQNTDTLKLSTAHDTRADCADIYMLPAEHGEFSDLFSRGVQDFNAIEGVERLRFFSYFHKFVRTYENAHYQFRRGALELEAFTGLSKQFISMLSMPGPQVYWQQRKSWYNEEFQAHVDGELHSPDRDTFKFVGT